MRRGLYRSWSSGWRRGLAAVFALSILLAACGSPADEPTAGVDTPDDNGEDTATDEPMATETLQYGLLAPFSGAAASWGGIIEASITYAMDAINEDGGVVVGDTRYEFELVTFDHGYDPTMALSVARDAIERQGLKYIENGGVGVVDAIQPLAEQHGALLICLCGGNEFLGEDHPLTFRNFYDVPLSLMAMLDYQEGAAPDSGRRVIGIYPDDDAGHTNSDRAISLAEERGWEMTIEFIPRAETDVAPAMTRVLAQNPDIIDVGPSPDRLYTELMIAAGEQGFEGTWVFPDALHFDTVLGVVPDDQLVGSLSAPCPNPRTEAAQEWHDYMLEAVGAVPAWAGQSHDSVRLLALAIEEAQSVDPEVVADALGEVVYEDGVTAGGGPISYGHEDQFGIPRAFNPPYPVCQVQEGSDGLEMVEVNAG